MAYFQIYSRKAYHRVPNFCMDNQVTYIVRFQWGKKIGDHFNPILGTLLTLFWPENRENLEKMKKNKKYLELPDLARKLIRKSFKKICPPPQKKIRFFLRKNEKCLELPDLARKLIRKSFIKFCPSPPFCRNVRRKYSASADGGLSGGSRVRGHGSEDPHRR